MLMHRFTRLAPGVLTLVVPGLACAADAPKLDGANTAWMLASSLLVLFMTLPGLALFYGGLVRTKNVLSVMAQCLGIAGLVTPSALARRSGAVSVDTAYRLMGGPEDVLGLVGALEARDAGKVVREVKGQMTSLRAWYHYYASLAYFAILPWYLSRR